MTTIQEQIALLQAVADGKTLEFARKDGYSGWAKPEASWVDSLTIGAANFYFNIYNWRIKPEPPVRWLNECSDGAAVAYASESKARGAANYGNYQRIAVKYQEVL